ncbi:SLAM family member 8-like isoform X1 [Lagopus muta]|uniref:SLAM family member 8-like isoform X1 n=1 Tax=Lagopus muta TaxID=64668 RepID=UPI00209ED132|nr:SLAM family member 8-like isoform X1 [Lagopus muta]XP_048784837.1 SLAM family member 8-like isoform X1 [Lagopus muta]
MEGDLARRAARLLLALLGFAPELLFGQVRAQPQQVSGVLGGSVLLSPVLPPGSRVKEIEWSFSSGAGATIQVAEFGPGGFERPDPQDRFKQRLEMPNATALRIGALELGDSGVYGARIKLHPALVEDQSFNLSVYESVPRPRTHSQLLASTLEWCNLTLQCQGTGKGAVNVTWRRDNGRQELGTDRSQLSPDGTTLRLALQPGTANATYTCTVSNPADQKVVPFDLQSICRSGGGQVSFSKSGYIVLTLILLAVSLGGAFWCWRLNSEKSADPAATPTAPVEESPPEPQYTEIVHRSPPEGNDQGLRPPENNPEPTSTEKAPGSTVYEQIHQEPEDTAEEAPTALEHQDVTEGL